MERPSMLLFSIIVTILFWLWLLFLIQERKRHLQKVAENSSNKKGPYSEWELMRGTFAVWCFLCAEAYFQELIWVVDVIVWYAWGDNDQLLSVNEAQIVSSWSRVAIQILYDPNIISYSALLNAFWTYIDPADEWWQKDYRWFQYTTAIYYHTTQQYHKAISTFEREDSWWQYVKAIVTEIIPYTTFLIAPDKHQDVYLTHPSVYKSHLYHAHTSTSSSTEMPVNPFEKWNTISTSTQVNKIEEAPFTNAYYNFFSPWIYIDPDKRVALFSSKDKFDWGSWRADFTKTLSPDFLTYSLDTSKSFPRTWVFSQTWKHLGFVFDDWPVDAWGKRFTIYSDSLKFIPADSMKTNEFKIRLPYL